jgi:putative Mg2+ transporter-C (MgtC) family protein
VGVERQLSNKPAGIRTSILISLGTYIFIAAGQLVQGEVVDPTRIIGQVVTGIGFIGAGVILTRGEIVTGITSASVIWMLAGIGVLIGLEQYAVAVILSILTVAILIGVTILEKFISSFRKGIYAKLTSNVRRKTPG